MSETTVSMSTAGLKRLCPDCGLEIPSGDQGRGCPNCLLHMALSGDGEPAAEAGPASRAPPGLKSRYFGDYAQHFAGMHRCQPPPGGYVPEIHAFQFLASNSHNFFLSQ